MVHPEKGGSTCFSTATPGEMKEVAFAAIKLGAAKVRERLDAGAVDRYAKRYEPEPDEARGLCRPRRCSPGTTRSTTSATGGTASRR
jgi:hypothetical protein